MRTYSALSALVSGALVAATLVGCGTATDTPPATGLPAPTSTSSASESGYFVDWKSPAQSQVQQWEAEGRSDDAEQIRKIASQPFPMWPTGDVAAVEGETRDYVGRAKDANQRPLLVAYNVPHRDCGSFSGGGAPNGDYYRNWIAGLVRGLDGTPSTVVLEPDAVPHEISGCVDGALRDERYALLGQAIDALKAGGAAVYIDAGNPGFISDVDALSGALDRSGVKRADGFSLNVANFYPTAASVEFGTRISQKLGGSHFVVDTSRNGRGPATQQEIGDAPAFCNPPGRGLGANPTTNTGNPLVDALLWVKRPGESDGACRPGEPAAGQWYPDYALGLAQRQQTG
ncbi:glycoside hydrolase family 6 protein [Pseudonocardia sediminis]|uniref:glycoside hydrolase family 6 protein n=1 Tax=Pseudonocardia sediminis TaxID=1397368 RepID=UPI001F5FBB16|nr:glycoside hydrolase family 6 protein [Pseudonocardia sediminis]